MTAVREQGLPWDDPDADPLADTRAWAAEACLNTGGRPEPVMQPRCVFCGHEHYGPAVSDISHGLAACERCGRVPDIFYDERVYRAARRLHFHQEDQ